MGKFIARLCHSIGWHIKSARHIDNFVARMRFLPVKVGRWCAQNRMTEHYQFRIHEQGKKSGHKWKFTLVQCFACFWALMGERWYPRNADRHAHPRWGIFEGYASELLRVLISADARSVVSEKSDRTVHILNANAYKQIRAKWAFIRWYLGLGEKKSDQEELDEVKLGDEELSNVLNGIHKMIFRSSREEIGARRARGSQTRRRRNLKCPTLQILRRHAVNWRWPSRCRKPQDCNSLVQVCLPQTDSDCLKTTKKASAFAFWMHQSYRSSSADLSPGNWQRKPSAS